MSITLDRVNAAPIASSNFNYEFNQWIANLVDTINEVIDNTSGLLVSQSLVGSTVAAVDVTVNTLYIPTNAAQVAFQLPDTTANDIGSIVEIAGFGAGGWELLTGTGQTIKVGSVNMSATTSITSANQYDSIKIILVDAATWITLSSETTGFTIV